MHFIVLCTGNSEGYVINDYKLVAWPIVIDLPYIEHRDMFIVGLGLGILLFDNGIG